ncbi:MAG: alpha/beta hydrolase [Methylobacteriaceae bacterium]|nr:alpha/beta hydrolase [Methylobacteriaceae bacterium]
MKGPSEDETQAHLSPSKATEKVPADESKIYGKLHITRFIDSEGVFNPEPVAVRVHRPSSTTRFVRDIPEPGATLSANLAESTGKPDVPPQAVSPIQDMTKLVGFETAPFPYHGAQPGGGPFLNAGDDRKAHRTSRGQLLWEDETFADNRVLLHIPAGFDPARPSVLVVFFHGWGATLTRDVLERQQVAAQVSASGANAILIAPQFASDARDSSAGKFWQPNAFRRFLAEAAQKLAREYGDPASERSFARAPIILVAYSGGFMPAAFSLQDGGVTDRVRGVVLLDAAYGRLDTFANWIGGNKSGFFLSAYTYHTQGHNSELKSMIAARGVALHDSLGSELSPGTATFIGTGSEASHTSYVTHAWDDDPLKIILTKLPEFTRPDNTPVASIDQLRTQPNRYSFNASSR